MDLRQRGGEAMVLLCAGLLAILLVMMLLPVAGTLAIGAMAASVAAPSTERMARRFGGRRRLAALLMASLIVIALAVPLGFAVFLAIGQLVDLGLSLAHRRPAPGWQEELTRRLRLPVPRIEQVLSGLAQRAVPLAEMLAARSLQILLAALLLAVTLYALLSDGRSWLRALRRIPPLDSPVAKLFIDEFREVARSVLLGSYLTALLHGVAGGLAFLAFGLPRALLWGAVMTVSSLIPGIGTALVWGPAAVVLALEGHWMRSAGLTMYGLFVMGAIDYLVRPALSRGSMRLPEYGVLVSMIGGAAAFGLPGLFVGPMIASLALVALAVVGRQRE